MLLVGFSDEHSFYDTNGESWQYMNSLDTQKINQKGQQKSTYEINM